MHLFLRQLRAELHKLFARKRTYIGFGAFLFIEVLVLALLQLPRVQRAFKMFIEANGYEFGQYYSGLTLAFIILSATIVILGSLYLALVSGDVVSKEVEDGTMRMMLCRPISRLRILVVKYLACVIYTFALIWFIGLTALTVGILRQGTGGLFVWAPLEGVFALFDFGPGLRRYLAALFFMSLSLTTISSFGFMLSCCRMKPAAATIVTLSIAFIDMVFRSIEQFASIRPFLITTHMASWINVFRPSIRTWEMLGDYAYLLGVDVTLFVIGALIFLQRDLKS
jgi:ABC-2 type transport system permease protein